MSFFTLCITKCNDRQSALTGCLHFCSKIWGYDNVDYDIIFNIMEISQLPNKMLKCVDK